MYFAINNDFIQGCFSIQDIESLVQIAGIVVGVPLAISNLKNIKRSVLISKDASAATVVAHCADRYDFLMKDLSTMDKSSEEEKLHWSYRLCDLRTEEFYLAKNGVLEIAIFKIWMTELASSYNQPVRNFPWMRSHKHYQDLYLQNVLPGREKEKKGLHDFYSQIEAIAADGNAEARSMDIEVLLNDFFRARRRFCVG